MCASKNNARKSNMHCRLAVNKLVLKMCVIREDWNVYQNVSLSPHKYAIFKWFSHLSNLASGWYALPKHTIASAQNEQKKKKKKSIFKRPQFLHNQHTILYLLLICLVLNICVNSCILSLSLDSSPLNDSIYLNSHLGQFYY